MVKYLQFTIYVILILIISFFQLDDYLKARRKAKQAEDTSDLASDLNTDLEKKQRKYRSVKRYSSTSRSTSSESELEVIPSPPTIPTIGRKGTYV